MARYKETDKVQDNLFIPDQYFRKRNIRFSEKKRFVRREKGKFSRDDFKYNKRTDHFTLRS